jgi:rhodanese-related sulfurtransferase
MLKMGLLDFIFGKKVDYKDLLANGALIIDVRSPQEYKTGHIKGSQNIPLEKIAAQSAKLKALNKPIITCCRSGMRSGAAVSTLKNSGVEAYNGGAWNTLRSKI